MSHGTSELQIFSEYIDRLYAAQPEMSDADASRAVRTIKHLEARISEIETGQRAPAW